MKKGNLSKEQAIQAVGAAAVEAVEKENCEPTGRVGYNGECRGDDLCEWSASVTAHDVDGDKVTLLAYYYTTSSEDADMAAADDMGFISWEIEGYEIV